jgi:hypothetical protein
VRLARRFELANVNRESATSLALFTRSRLIFCDYGPRLLSCSKPVWRAKCGGALLSLFDRAAPFSVASFHTFNPHQHIAKVRADYGPLGRMGNGRPAPHLAGILRTNEREQNLS